jgi:hypothetical protein
MKIDTFTSSPRLTYTDRLRARHAQTRDFRTELLERLNRAYGDEADRLEERIREIETDVALLEGRIAEAEAQA